MDLQRRTQCAVFLCRLRDNKKADHGVLFIRMNLQERTQCAVFLCRLRDNKKADHGVLFIHMDLFKMAACEHLAEQVSPARGSPQRGNAPMLFPAGIDFAVISA